MGKFHEDVEKVRDIALLGQRVSPEDALSAIEALEDEIAALEQIKQAATKLTSIWWYTRLEDGSYDPVAGKYGGWLATTMGNIESGMSVDEAVKRSS